MKLLKELALVNIQPMVQNFKKDSFYAKLLTECNSASGTADRNPVPGAESPVRRRFSG